jgi:hypothetical protein
MSALPGCFRHQLVPLLPERHRPQCRDKAEAEVKDAAEPKTLGGRGVALRRAEIEVAAAKPRDRRLCWGEMTTD